MQTVTQAIIRSWPCWLFGHPHGNDIVVDLVVGRDFNQLNGALSPIAQRLDPQTRSPLVMHAIQIMVKIAVSL
ncbi:NADPH:quinone reductase or related Zn-dependent oxidoreductase [Pseudomonas syringae pv. actinidiae]|uniref:NADPH:quinone reductase or related Zn-dependent oxidoreductase n=1 Tax=Pseudomonas syringae pv. actinidiae TaxID=103796 RepID=A0A2V0QEG8_PSESF|nr:NADPH:quinone reductase or related Zn-dependent oxidoreductase [Pseudomonas syringae pv. actinidiae]